MKTLKDWIEYIKSLSLEDWEEIEFHFLKRLKERKDEESTMPNLRTI